MGDLHCGALIGLTHPDWQQNIKDGIKDVNKRDKYARITHALWKQYKAYLKMLEPINVLFVNGDMIDGNGHRSGGTELITTDRTTQAEMATKAINEVRLHAVKRGFKIIGTYGTAYHTGQAEDFENIVARDADFTKIGSHEWPEVNGKIFDLKHHIGNTSVPYGKGTALAKSGNWNDIWAIDDMQPRADIVLRSHVHRFYECRDLNKMHMTLPALCGMGSKFGSRICEGVVHFGLVHFDIDHHGNVVDWDVHAEPIAEQKATTTKL
jgi:hypothetical protein